MLSRSPGRHLPRGFPDSSSTPRQASSSKAWPTLGGCEYREVEIANSGRGTKAHAFVLPEQPATPGRFVVCWDGLVYPALKLGAAADLDRDVNDLAARLKEAKDAGQFVFWGFPGDRQNPYGLAGVEASSPIKLCLLLRLGRADLAEALFAAGTTWTPGPRPPHLANYGISYLTLATNWASSAFTRLIETHTRGEDLNALDMARRLVKFRDLAMAQVEGMRLPPESQWNQRGTGPAPHFSFLTQLDDLLRDQERRAKLPPRGPIPRQEGDPTARIAALIRDLDLIDGPQLGMGAVNLSASLLVRELIAEGDAAVPPLLKVLESDHRLTRLGQLRWLAWALG